MYNNRENNPGFGKQRGILISLGTPDKKTYQAQLIEQHLSTHAR